MVEVSAPEVSNVCVSPSDSSLKNHLKSSLYNNPIAKPIAINAISIAVIFGMYLP